ncbi:unnamed protein product, partial [Mesorhabditis belari]|uniref:Peptidase M12B domain-containing protein n=1 Tax=Mesorhabditis belari TaxID=2138241 RepID=A0AAF3FDC2_9BILA
MAMIVQFFSFFLLLTQIDAVIKYRRKDNLGKVKLLREIKMTNSTQNGESSGKVESYMGVSLLMVGDYSFYKNFFEIAGDEEGGLRYSKEYLTAIYEQVRAIYDEIPFDFGKLHLSLVDTFVAIRPIDCPLLQPDDMSPNELERNVTLEELFELKNGSSTEPKYSGPDALRQLFNWKKRYEDLLPPHDHTMLVTKMDLLSFSGSDSSQGMAPLAALCKGGESSSVVEDAGAMATAIIAAHELGHNLGAAHDNSNSTECNQSLTYLMAPSVSTKVDDDRFFNIRRFSPCSLENIHTYLNSSNAHCARKKGRLSIKSKKVSALPMDSFPGERFSATQQCQAAFGKGYGLCPKLEYVNLGGDPCRRIWCKNRRTRRSGPCETLPFFPAFDGTTCGMNRWCMKGSCVPNEKRLLECQDLNDDVCRKYTKAKLKHYCKSMNFQAVCCSTCTRAMSKELQLEKKL